MLELTKDFNALEPDWNRLSAQPEYANVFMTFDWMRAWGGNFEIITVKRGSEIVGIAPLVRNGRSLKSLDSPADYNDLVVGEGLTDVLAHLKAHVDWDVIRFQHFRLTEAVRQALDANGLRYTARTEPHPCPYFPLVKSWSQMARNKTVRNQINRLTKDGFRARIIETPQTEPQLLEKMIALEKQKRVQRRPVQPFLARYYDTFKSLFETLGARGWLYVALMERGDEPVAWQLGYRCGDKLWDYQKAYDKRWHHLSPGTALMGAVIDYGLSHGYHEYDFLRGKEDYKLRWAVASRDLSQLEVYRC